MRYRIEQRNVRRPVRRGFTLMELMVVMLVLGLLMGILMPIVGVVRQKMQIAKSRVRIETIGRGVETYWLVHKVYPGERDLNTWEPQTDATPLPDGIYTGSQILAAHMFGYYDETQDIADPYHKISESNPEPSSTDYMNWEAGMLIDRGSSPGQKNFLSDAFSTPMPVAYYPPGGGVGTAQFNFHHNAAFTGSTVNAFRNHITDADYGTGTKSPHRDNEFLLIAPGPDKVYFNDDDVHNWPG